MLTRTKRRFLFYTSVFIFIIMLVPILFYSLGYRVSSDFKILKTGGIFIQASQAGAELVIGARHKRTSFLGESALVKNLPPDTTYKISVLKDGFWPYIKELKVESETVTARNVLLIPQNIEGKILGTSTPKIEILKPNLPAVKRFWSIPGTNDFIILGDDGKFYRNKELFDVAQAWGTTTYEILKGNKKSIFDENFSRLIYWDASVIDSYWIDKEDKLPRWQDQLFYRIGPIKPTNSIRSVFSYPGWPDWLLIAMENGVFVLEIDHSGGQNVFPLYKGKKPDIISVEPDKIIILDDKRYIEITSP